MKLSLPTAEIFVADGLAPEAALKRTTVMGVAAHQDDLEIFAYHGILKAFCTPGEAFTGVVATNGSGSPRAGVYAQYTDEAMRALRRREQCKAAVVGNYAAAILLDYPSAALKSSTDGRPVADLKAILLAARPQVVYTHNPADKHDTHVGTALRLLEAVRALPAEARPKTVYGCEVWRDLDWMCDPDKVALPVDGHENLAAALLGVYDSQIAGGKRYDLATMGRRRAHATYHASHDTDTCAGLTFAMDLTPLVTDPGLCVSDYVTGYIERFAAEVKGRLGKMS